MRRVASRARGPATFEVTSRKRWPLVRVWAPTRGSTCRAVSGESGARSASGTTPSFIWIRWATAVLVASLLGRGGIIAPRPVDAPMPPGVTPSGSASPDGDAQLTHRRAARCPGERGHEVVRVEQHLLADDRRVRLDDQRLAVDAQGPAGAVGGRRPLRDDRVEGGEEPGPAELVGQAQARRRVRDERADARHWPPPARGVVGHPPRSEAPPSSGRTS